VPENRAVNVRRADVVRGVKDSVAHGIQDAKGIPG
jgi:hypothetical protein